MALKMSETYGSIPRNEPPSCAVAAATRPQDDSEFVQSVTAWIPNLSTISNARTPRLEVCISENVHNLSVRLTVIETGGDSTYRHQRSAFGASSVHASVQSRIEGT